MPSKNEIDYEASREYFGELISELMAQNKGNYNYLESNAKKEVALKVGLSYSQLNRRLKPYVATEKQVQLFVEKSNQLELFNNY